jgi:hypothetical protein
VAAKQLACVVPLKVQVAIVLESRRAPAALALPRPSSGKSGCAAASAITSAIARAGIQAARKPLRGACAGLRRSASQSKNWLLWQ